jgi:hypothetical protein
MPGHLPFSIIVNYFHGEKGYEKLHKFEPHAETICGDWYACQDQYLAGLGSLVEM